MKLSVPKIDLLAGISCYCTNFNGIGGKIKSNPSDFIVSEILHTHYINSLTKDQTTDNKYPIYIMNKVNLDTHHAVMEVRRKYGIKLKFLGIKDSKALTEQYVSLDSTKNIQKQYQTEHVNIKIVGFAQTPLNKSLLLGNRFRITIRHANRHDIGDFLTDLDKIGNFYGLQRFGSERLVSHIVGKEIIKKNYKNALKILLCYTTEYDSKFSKEIRESLMDERNYRKILKIIPRGMDIEGNIVSQLLKNNNPMDALRSIPLTVRRIFVQAYQAFLFNRCLSQSIVSSESINECKDGDICFEYDKNEFGKIVKYNIQLEKNKNYACAIPLVGYTFTPKSRRFDIMMQRLLNEEGISSKDFYIKDFNELSEQGGFRPAKLYCTNFRYSDKLTVSFSLPKGSYATTILREIMQPVNPILAGF